MLHRLRCCEHGDFDLQIGQFLCAHRREARVVQCGGEGIGLHVLQQRAMGLQAADAASELAIFRERDKGGAELLKGLGVDELGRCEQNVLRQAAAGEADELLALGLSEAACRPIF